MDLGTSAARFAAHVEGLGSVLGHADRIGSVWDYCAPSLADHALWSIRRTRPDRRRFTAAHADPVHACLGPQAPAARLATSAAKRTAGGPALFGTLALVSAVGLIVGRRLRL